MDGRVLTCVYCGHEYPQDTPASGDKVLTDHIRVCPKHPLRKAEADITLLRNALIGLFGVSDPEGLRELESVMKIMASPGADKDRALDAIRALLETTPKD